MLATILIIVSVAVVAVYVIRRRVAAKRTGLVEITDAEGKRHQIPPPPSSVRGNIAQTNVRFTTAIIPVLSDYLHKSLPAAGWAFVDVSPVSSDVSDAFSLVFRRVDKRLNVLVESPRLSLRKAYDSRTKLTYNIAVGVKPSQLEEDLAAIKSLGKAGNKDAVEILLAFLDDQRPRVRREAVAALITIKDERALRPLIRRLTDDDEGVRQHAAVALGELGSKEAVEPLIAGLNTGDPGLQTSCAYALGCIKDDRAVRPLIGALKGPYVKLITYAAIALGEFGDRSAVQPLTACLRDTNNDPQSRVMAYMSLKKLLNPSEVSAVLASLPTQSGQDSFKEAVAENVAEFATESIFDFLGIEH